MGSSTGTVEPAVENSATVRDRISRLGWALVDVLVRVFHSRPASRLHGRGHYLALVPAILIVSVLVFGLGRTFWTSIHSYDSVTATQGSFSLESYSALGDSFYLDAAARTVWMSAVATLISIALAVPLAYVLVRARSQALRALLLVAIFVPFLTGELVRGYGWIVVLGSDGLVAWTLDLVGISGFDAIGTSGAVILGIVQVVMPICALIIVPAMRSIDPDLENVSGTLGANRWRTWTRVVLPLAGPGIIGATAVAVALSLTEFAMPALLGGGFQDFAANLVYQAQFVQNNPPLAAALAAVILVIAATFVGLISASVRRVEKRVIGQ